MPVITDIKPQKKKGRINIYLDGKFAFGLDLETYARSGMKLGKNLERDEIEEIVKKSQLANALQNAYKFTTRRPRSYWELNKWFERKAIHESVRKKIIKKLEKYDLLDDVEFARWWLGQRSEFRARSRKMLYKELLEKGVDKRIIKKVLEENPPNEYKSALVLVKKNMGKWEKLEASKKREKIYGYLSRKGYGWDVVKKVIGELEFDQKGDEM